MKRRQDKGFTLIELMVVITIIGLLASVAAVGVMGHLKTAKIETTKTSMRALRDACKMYYLKHNQMPDSLSALCGPENDDTRLIESEEPPKDGWGNDFVYTKKDKRNIEIMSYGADGQEGGVGEDKDIVLADLNKSSEDDTSGGSNGK